MPQSIIYERPLDTRTTSCQYADEKKQDKASLYEILDEISQSTKTCRTFPEWFEYIKAYTEQLQNKKPDNAGGGSGGNSMDSVTVSTMHASKGLEYKKVFLVGLNEGNVPYHKAVLEKELEEERRMFYVAMTRAKEELHLYFPRGARRKSTENIPLLTGNRQKQCRMGTD